MKTLLIEAEGPYADDKSVGLVHLDGPIDGSACGLDYGDYECKHTTKPITCGTCLEFLAWAKSVAKKINQ